MNASNPAIETNKAGGNLRNFDLTVDEIRLQRTIDSMSSMLKRIEEIEPQSPRVKNIHVNIRKLKQQLDEIRDNTLIR